VRERTRKPSEEKKASRGRPEKGEGVRRDTE